MKKRLVIANWKMYIESPEEAKKFVATLRRKARSYQGAEAWVAPAFPLLPFVAEKLKGSKIKAGGQDCSAHESGAHTGEVSADTLKNTGAHFCIVGHSERRSKETGVEIRAQFARALSAGLVGVLCVGEQAREQDGTHFG